MRNFLALFAAAVGLLVATKPVWGHHAFAAEFDEKRPLKLKGVVTRVELINPHSWFHIDVTNADGSKTSWMIEGGSPNALYRLGYKKDMLPEGTEIVIDGYQAKDGANRAVGKDFTFPDGRRMFLGSPAPGSDGKEETKQ